MKMKNIFFQNLELKHFAHIALPVGFKQGICPQFNTITVYGIGNGSSTQHHTGDLSLEMNGIIQRSGEIRTASGRIATKSQSEERPHSF